jgi:gliding motility-associated lipoprotein GldH
MHKKSSGYRISVTVITACFFLSCSQNIVYNEFQPIQNKVWDKHNEYYFNFEIKDVSVQYDISLKLRNNNLYPYQNIWIFFEESRSSGISVKDTIEYMLADDFGKWTGNGITLFQSHIPLKNHYLFPDTGKYTISVRHGMRDDKLKGIEDIGLFIEKSK